MIYDATIDDIDVFFNGNNLNTEPHKVLGVDARGMPAIKISKYQLARSDGELVTNVNYGARDIIVEGRTKCDADSSIGGDGTIGGAIIIDAYIDELKTFLVGLNKELVISINGEARVYTATIRDTKFDTRDDVCMWKLVFAASAIGKADDTESLSLGTPLTSSPTSPANTFLGTYNAQPILDLTVNQVDPYWTTKYMEFENAVLNRLLRISRTWNWYDRVIIDAEEKTVSLYATTKTVLDDCDVTTGWTSSHTLSLEAALMKEGVGCLKVVMAGAAAAMTWAKLNFTPTIDLGTTTGKVILPIFIPTPTAGAVASVELKIGSDATLAANYVYWTVATQWNGSALATNAWNYVVVDMAAGVTGTNGAPNRAAVKSLQVSINGTAATMRLVGAFLDYITLNKASATATDIDYEGIFPEFEPGSGTLVLTDEFTSRNITISGVYTKRYL